MRIFRALVPFLCLAPLGLAQLTPEQKIADFNQLVGLYAKNYAPYELKRDVFGFDMFNLKPWIDQINQSKTDIEYYDILVKYVASFQDSHDEFTIPSDFEAWMHMDGDIYDGKFLIDYIDRTYLPRAKYPFAVGDELVSVDGTPVADLLKSLAPYAVNGSSNPTSRQRLAAATITDRYQGWFPRAGDVQDNATIVVQRQGGPTETYTVPWQFYGTKLVNSGLTQTPKAQKAGSGDAFHAALRRSGSTLIRTRGSEAAEDGSAPNPWGVWTGEPAAFEPEVVPEYMQAQVALQNMSAAAAPNNFTTASGLGPFGAAAPVFNPPAGFSLRLGAKSTDLFLSGTYPSGTNKIGYIRIPTFSPASTTVALQQFGAEIQYMQQNTDGLVLDLMANGGGSICYTGSLASWVIPTTFRGAAQQLRATLTWRRSFSSSLQAAKDRGADQWVIDLYTAYLNEVNQALTENRGMTGALPLCGASFDVAPAADSKGNVLAYTKPIVLLTDNWTLSAAELFTMYMQDNNRATIFGTRTDGGGGNVVGFNSVTNYSEGNARVTEGLITRLQPVATPGFPALNYTDGVGVYPDIVQDYMTADNLKTGGTAFTKAFTAVLTDLIQKSK